MAWNKNKDVFALMVGHGKSIDGSWDSGCTYSKYTEAGLMLKIVKVAVKHLRASGVKVLTDADKDNNRNMISCVTWANKQAAKCYMSVHCDYKLASAGVYPLYVSSGGKKMCDTIGKAVAKDMGMKYKGAGRRPDLYELTATNMTACVFETGAIKADLSKLKDADKYGKALAKAICRYIGVEFKAQASKNIETVDHKAKYIVLPKDGMNVRESWTTQARVVQGVKGGATIKSTKKHGNWVYIPSHHGWICVKDKKAVYLQKV